jgi:phosphoribosyl 1,2-cyclic phosphodiesterase
VALQFCSLASGSRGNALLVESGSTLLLVDCGLSRRTLESRLQAVGREPADITAVLVTHEHSDHAQGVAALRRRYGLPVAMTAGTASMMEDVDECARINPGIELTLGSISVTPFTVPHDAREPVQFTFSDGKRRLGVLTDTGHITKHIVSRLGGCHGLALEFNHDLPRLRSGPYPHGLKERVASDRGHLNNDQSTQLLERVGHAELEWVVGLHVSEQNNTQALITDRVTGALPSPHCAFAIASQDSPSGWHRLD